MIDEESKKLVKAEEAHQKLVRAVSKAKPNVGNILLGKVEFAENGGLKFKVSPVTL